MFRKRNEQDPAPKPPAPVERVTSVLGEGIAWKGNLSGTGGIRIEGAFDGEINLRGLLVIGETGRVTGKQVNANVVIIAGALQADITAEKVEIRNTGRVWGNVVTAAFATEEGAFLRGQIRMEERVELAPMLETLALEFQETVESQARQAQAEDEKPAASRSGEPVSTEPASG